MPRRRRDVNGAGAFGAGCTSVDGRCTIGVVRLRNLYVVFAVVGASLVYAGPAMAQTTVDFSATLHETYGGPRHSPFPCAPQTACGSGDVVGLGHVTETLVPLDCGDDGGCYLRTITFEHASSTLVLQESAAGPGVPGQSSHQPWYAYGHASSVQLTDVVDGVHSSGRFAGAVGTLTGVARTAGAIATTDLAGPITLAHDPCAACAGLFQYVTDTMTYGSSAGEASGYGFDLDGDDVADNVLGAVFAGLSSVVDLDAPMNAALHAGDVVMLHTLRAPHSLASDPTASWQVFFGVPTPAPVLTGGGSFVVDPVAAGSTVLGGAITFGEFSGGPGAVAVRLGLLPGQPPIELHLSAARIQADCSASGCTHGKLGGAVAKSEVDTLMIPVLAGAMQAVIDASCSLSSPDTCSGQARQLLDLFDTNDDYTITADELLASPLITAVLAPDLDLATADGSPGHDGVKESVSLGLGFTAKNASFMPDG
jgi:hypothetical protein